jgi:hypothetical protein
VGNEQEHQMTSAPNAKIASAANAKISSLPNAKIASAPNAKIASAPNLLKQFLGGPAARLSRIFFQNGFPPVFF